MQLRRKKTPLPEFDRNQALAMVPVRNREVTENHLDSGLVRLTYPLALRPWYARIAARAGLWDGAPLIKRLELDRLGTFVWERINGADSVRDIASALATHFQLQNREAELSTAAFLKTLGQRGIIGIRRVESESAD